MEEFVCWCFAHTADDIRRDALREGRSVILEKILAAKKAGTCRCPEKHPRKT